MRTAVRIRSSSSTVRMRVPITKWCPIWGGVVPHRGVYGPSGQVALRDLVVLGGVREGSGFKQEFSKRLSQITVGGHHDEVI